MSSVQPDLWASSEATRRPRSLIHVQIKAIPPARHDENSPSAFSSICKSHFKPLPLFFIWFLSIFSHFYVNVAVPMGIHWNNVAAPLFPTHPMCLLLATLKKKREGGTCWRRKRERKEGEESDMLRAWEDMQNRASALNVHEGVHSWKNSRYYQKRDYNLFPDVFFLFFLPSFASCYTRKIENQK